MDGWEWIEKEVVRKWAVPAADRIAEACNEQSSAAEHPGFFNGKPTTDAEKRGYRSGTEGRPGYQLHKRSYHATVITTTKPAMADNARHSRLVMNLHLASNQ